ncbi:Rieske (2Fe-2S) protein [Simiduia sp. 21SJ11W-1]|uniref:Rieske (2Fe-2S) protein n=1 Tax=Simiduia sp. 21SJ11W-1 TaxID=2909669 RepID=UPI00209E947F|nr:Rieske (2Fe-2S) protein [Simiduia sp. 21SJ11W-1]UTA48672.1 Rieske (2Fe-2S) protein [Simiduia sp. 21SJ11W-1]
MTLPEGQATTPQWYPLCPADAIGTGQSKQFSINGTALFVVNQGGCYFAFENRCPHLGIELQWQPDRFLDAEGEFIQCSTHGALFLIEDGECIAGPCRGQSLRPLPIKTDAGQLLIKVP